MIDKEQFKKEMYKYDGKNQEYWDLEGLPLLVTNGVKFVVETLNAPFILFFVKKAMEDERILYMRIKHGCKNLFIMNVTEEGCRLSLHINDEEVAHMDVNDRPDLPHVRVPMIMGNQVLYLLCED